MTTATGFGFDALVRVPNEFKKRITIARANVTQLGRLPRNAKFDAITVCNVISKLMFEERYEAAEQVRDRLAPDGFVLSTEPIRELQAVQSFGQFCPLASLMETQQIRTEQTYIMERKVNT